MTKLTTTEIKGIIAERGSNVLSATVQVPSDFFYNSKADQEAYISEQVIGVREDIVRLYFCPFTKILSHAFMLEVRLEFTDEVLARLEEQEDTNVPVHEGDVFIERPISLERLHEYANRGIKMFTVQGDPAQIEGPNAAEYISSLLTPTCQFEGISFFHTARNLESNLRTIVVVVPNILEQIRYFLEIEANDRTVYEALDVEGAVFLPRALANEDLQKLLIQEEGFLEREEDEHEVYTPSFAYLVQVDYDFLFENTPEVIEEHYKRLILGQLSHNIRNLEHEVVGINPNSSKLIVKVTGLIVVSY